MVSEKFEASNGLDVLWHEDETRLDVVGEGCDESYWVDWDIYRALKEFFMYVRDKELGRWRDPENFNCVVYPTETDDTVNVFNEAEPENAEELISQGDPRDWHKYYPSAQKYFELHSEPKPWKDANPGEVWVLTVHGEQFPYYVEDDCNFKAIEENAWLSRKATGITAGHCIYPEEK